MLRDKVNRPSMLKAKLSRNLRVAEPKLQLKGSGHPLKPTRQLQSALGQKIVLIKDECDIFRDDPRTQVPR
jgi:hypothetical protein